MGQTPHEPGDSSISFLRLVDNGTLDEARGPIAENSTFWDMLHGLDKNRPDWIPEVLAHRLRRRFANIRDSGEGLGSKELLGYDGTAVEMIRESAERMPAVFIEHVLPVVLEISDSALTSNEPPEIRCRLVGSHQIRVSEWRGCVPRGIGGCARNTRTKRFQ